MLGSPIILYDYPEIARESTGSLFDATEIDEILMLRVLTMTDAEKAEARATDPKAAEIIDRCDAMSPEDLMRLHVARFGAIRTLCRHRGVTASDPFAIFNDHDPETGEVMISGTTVRQRQPRSTESAPTRRCAGRLLCRSVGPRHGGPS